MISVNTILLIVGVGAFILIAGGTGLLLFFRNQAKKRFPFMVYSKDGKTRYTIFGTIKKDPENPYDQKFFFDKYPPIKVSEPSAFVDGKPIREVTFNDLGELSYIDTNLKDDKYKTHNITPEEKQLALNKYKEARRRFENTMNKYQAAVVIGAFLLILVLILGIIYASVSYANAAKSMGEVAKENSKVSNDLKQIAETNKEVSEQLLKVSAALTSGTNITRNLS